MFSNLAITSLFLIHKHTVKLFFGNLREMEKIYVIEKIKRKFMEIAFLLMLFNQKDLTKLFFSHLSIYLLLNSLHLIATKRSEFISLDAENSYFNHIRLVSFFFILILIDYYFIFHVYNQSNS